MPLDEAPGMISIVPLAEEEHEPPGVSGRDIYPDVKSRTGIETRAQASGETQPVLESV